MENTLELVNEVETTENVIENTEVVKKGKQGRKAHTRKIAPINQDAYSGFAASFSNPVSWSQYNVTIGAFVEKLGNRGCFNVYAKEIESFLAEFTSNAKNREAKMATAKIHLNCFYRWLGENGYREKLQTSVKDWMIWG